jgi:hypothetical protein
MTSFLELTESVLTHLHSYTGAQETYTWLTVGADADDLTLTVNTSDSFYRGIAEIEDELVFIDTADSGALSLAPFGRGYKGSTAASHAANTLVLFDPSFPRAEVKKRINQVIAGLYPTLYQVKTTSFTSDGIDLNIVLPADAGKVLGIAYQIPGDPTGFWRPFQAYRVDPKSSDGNVLLMGYPIATGATVQVTYQAPFGALSANGDTLSSIGLPESCVDLIQYGVTSHMIRFLDPTRLMVTNVENVSRAQVVQAGDAAKVATQLYAMYQQRLAEERRKLLLLNPPTINYQD